MILSDREIQIALRRGAFTITPPPPDIDAPVQAGEKSPWSSTSLDLRFDNRLTFWRKRQGGADVTSNGPDYSGFNLEDLLEQYAEEVAVPETGYEFLPGDFALGWTKERVKFPSVSRIAARVEGKSSLARLGIGIHVTAPTIHAGFGVDRDNPDDPSALGSPIQLEIFHHGKYPVRLRPGMLICQLIFEEVHGTPQKGYEQRGRFAIQGAKPLPPK